MTTEKKNNYVEAYMELLNNLSDEVKIEIITKLRESLNNEYKQQINNDFYSAYGSWAEEETAEELIEIIKQGRVDTRVIEEF